MVYCAVQSTAEGFTKPKQPHWKKSARFRVNPRLPRKEEDTSQYTSSGALGEHSLIPETFRDSTICNVL